MNDFKTIVKRLKEYIRISQDTKVLDKDIASLLEISQSQFATLKRRNSTPYADILKFCKREKLSCNKIFFD